MATIQDLQKNANITFALGAIDVGGAEKTCDYINMALYDNVDYIFCAGVITNTTVFTFTQCTEDADAGGDVKALETATTLTLTGTTDNNSIEIVTITPALLDLNGGFHWVKCTTTTHGATALLSVIVIGYRSRHAEGTMPSMIT